MSFARRVALLAPLFCGCGDVEEVSIAPRTNAVRCDCACGLEFIAMSQTVDVCIDRDVEPSSGGEFNADDLTALCDEICTGGVQAQAQESLVAENVITDACAVSCSRVGPPEGLHVDRCAAQDGETRINCRPRRCPTDLPGDPERRRRRLLACTQVVSDSRADPDACGPARPTRPLCLVDDETESERVVPANEATAQADDDPSCGASGIGAWGIVGLLVSVRGARRGATSEAGAGPHRRRRRR